jgi:hypothetical protein
LKACKAAAGTSDAAIFESPQETINAVNKTSSEKIFFFILYIVLKVSNYNSIHPVEHTNKTPTLPPLISVFTTPSFLISPLITQNTQIKLRTPATYDRDH